MATTNIVSLIGFNLFLTIFTLLGWWIAFHPDEINRQRAAIGMAPQSPRLLRNMAIGGTVFAFVLSVLTVIGYLT